VLVEVQEANATRAPLSSAFPPLVFGLPSSAITSLRLKFTAFCFKIYSTILGSEAFSESEY